MSLGQLDGGRLHARGGAVEAATGVPEGYCAVAMEQTSSDDLNERPRHVSRKHHYVPRFLLANFTSDDQHPGKLCYFDNGVGVSRWQSPTGVARETDFYTVDVPGQPPDLIEGYFAKVETLVAPTIKRIVADRQMPEGHEYVDLMHFLALMYTRGPAFREMILQGIAAPVEAAMRLAAASPRTTMRSCGACQPTRRSRATN